MAHQLFVKRREIQLSNLKWIDETTPTCLTHSLSHAHTQAHSCKECDIEKLTHLSNIDSCCLCPNSHGVFFTLSCRQSCGGFLNQVLWVPQCRLHCWRCLHTEAEESGRCSTVYGVCIYVCAFVWTPTVSGIWRIGTVIWAARRISHKQMKARSLKVRLISLSELHREYSEYGEGFLSPRGSKGSLLSPLFPTSTPTITGKNGPGASFVFINIHSFIVCPGSWNVDKTRRNGRARNPLCLKLSLELKENNPQFFLNPRQSHTFHLVTENFSICASSLQ